MKIAVLALLTAATCALAPRPASAAIAGEGLAGYFSTDDHFNHVVVAQSNANVDECWWQDGGGDGCVTLVNLAPLAIVSISGFYSSYDRARHAVAAASNGQIWDYHYVPGGSAQLDLVGTISTSTWGRIITSASYATPDRFQHYVVGTSAGHVLQVRWSPYQSGGGLEVVGHSYNSLSSVSAFYQSSTEYVCVRGDAGSPLSMLYVATFNGDTTANTPVVAEFDEIGEGGTVGLIGFKWIADGFSLPGILYGYSNGCIDFAESAFGYEYQGQGSGSCGGHSLSSFGAYFESNNGTYHSLVATPNGDIYDVRMRSGATTWQYLMTYP